MQQKHPQLVIGVFLFNNENELFLKTSPQQQGAFTCLNGKIAWGDTIEQTIKKIVNSTINVSVEQTELIGLTNGLHIHVPNTDKPIHMVFADYKAYTKDTKNFSIDSSRNYDWLTPQQWLEKPDSVFGPYIKEVIVKLV